MASRATVMIAHDHPSIRSGLWILPGRREFDVLAEAERDRCRAKHHTNTKATGRPYRHAQHAL